MRDARAGERLVGEGVTGYLFFVVSSGEVAVTVGGRPIATLGPGDFFGEMALLGLVRHVATVMATAASRLLVLFSGDFERLRARHAAVAAEIDATAKQRFEELAKD